MENNIFRKKSMERVSSPEQLNDYLRVCNPGIWLILATVILLLVGVCIWGIFGRLETTVPAVAVNEDGETYLYVKEADMEKIAPGQKVTIKGNTYVIAEVAAEPTEVDNSFSQYALHVGNMQPGEWVYGVKLKDEQQRGTGQTALRDGIYSSEIVTDSVSPMSFVFN